jgi:uncharacterized membrane protein YidH (DUF202 family)
MHIPLDQILESVGDWPPTAIIGAQVLLLFGVPAGLLFCHSRLDDRTLSPIGRKVWWCTVVSVMILLCFLGIVSIAVGYLRYQRYGFYDPGDQYGHAGGLFVAGAGLLFFWMVWAVYQVRHHE